MTIRQLLEQPLVFLDGGTGTMLQARGLKPGERTELWNVERPEELVALHRSYIEAGADIVNTNTFGINKFHYHENTAHTIPELVQAAVENVRKAIGETGADRDIFISLDLGPTGEFLEPYGDLTFDEAYDNYRQLVQAGAAAGVESISIETMFSCEEAKAALKACRDHSSLPVLVSFSFSENGRLLSGETVEQVAAAAEEYGAAAVGFNCGFGPEQMKPLAAEMLKCTSLPVIVKPNAGLPDTSSGEAKYTMGPEEFAGIMEGIVQMGVKLIGGCCGTTPAFISQLNRRFRK